MKKTVVVFLIILFIQVANYIFGAIPAEERVALIALYTNTGGDSWSNNSGWKTPPQHTDGFALPGTEENWYGVIVSDNYVTSIILESNKLSGSIPFQFGNLSKLQYLWLDHNQLNGSIPSQLGNLSNLVYLILSDNKLSGSIPSQLGNLSNLVYLTLSDNKLSGSIPYELGALHSLKLLKLRDNQLTGAIPLSFLSLKSLEYLDICNNCLFAVDPVLRTWLDAYDPDWEALQDQCDEDITKPLVTTNPVSAITSTGANCGGNVTSDGGDPIIHRGVCWKTSANPTIVDAKTDDGTSAGSFASTISGLSPGLTYYVRAYAINRKGTGYGEDIAFTTLASPGNPTIALSHSTLIFGAAAGGEVTGAQTVLIDNIGGGTLNWIAAADADWLSFSPASGNGNSVLSVSVDANGLSEGDYTGAIRISDANASNSPQTITIALHIYKKGQTSVPFGEFATPVDGSTGYNSIPVTGWALDDIEVANVKIYNGNTYIGDAVFVDGARPDVEVAYLTYPNNYKSGWGYMLLTHFLPNGGYGTYIIIAKATDKEGHVVTLGSKTITVDNTHSEKPFGAIDKPEQGGTAASNPFINWGWVLTPQPNKIPITGKTLAVYVDGVNLGHPVYDLYREDIASLFPGYANSSGAAGYFSLDTMAYDNGLHTISWAAVDDAGNTDGIGSRYFSIANVGSSSSLASSGSPAMAYSHVLELESLPVNDTEPVRVAHGFARSGESLERHERHERELFPDINGTVAITLKELEPLEICLGETIENMAALHGYMVVDGSLRALPIGSTLDRVAGRFYWLPGPGFIGTYELVFIMEDGGGQRSCRKVHITIVPAR